MPLALFTPREAEAHVNACLDSQQAPTSRSHPVSDSRPRSRPSSRSARDDTNSATASDRPHDHDVSTSIPLCGVCGRDLSRLTETARAEHANRCADSVLPLPPRRARGTGQQQQEEQPASSRLSRRNNSNSRRRRDQGGGTATATTAARDCNTTNSNGEPEEEEPKGDPRVEHLLSMLGLQRYVKRFVVEEIDLVALRLLNDDDLAALSIPEAARRRIADAMHSVPILAQLQLQQTSTRTAPTTTRSDKRNETPLTGNKDDNMNQSTESKQNKQKDKKEPISKQQENSNVAVIEDGADADVNVDGNVEQEPHEELNTDFIAPTQQFTRSRLATRMRRTAGALLDTGSTGYNAAGNDGDFDDLELTYNPTPLPPPVVHRPVEVTTTDAISNATTAAAAAATATVAATAAVTTAPTTDAAVIETDSPPSPLIPPAPDAYKPEDAKGTSLQHRADIELELGLGPVPKAGSEPVPGLGSNPPTPPPVAQPTTGPAPFCDVANGRESPLLPVPPRDAGADKRGTTHQLDDSYNSQLFLSPPARNADDKMARTNKTRGHRQNKREQPKLKHCLRQHNDVDAYHLGDGADERSVNLTMCESRPEGEDKHGNRPGREQIRIFIEEALHSNSNDKKHRDRDRNIDMETFDDVDGGDRDRLQTHQKQRSQPPKSKSKSKSKSKLEQSRHSGGDGCNNSSNESSSSSSNSMASLASDLGDLHRVTATQSQISVEGLLAKWRHRLISREQRRHRDELDRIERDYRNALGQTLLTRRRRRRSDSGDGGDGDDDNGDEQSRSPVRCKKKPRSPPSFANSFQMAGGDHYNAYDNINGDGVEDRNGNGSAGYERDRVLQSVRNNRQGKEKGKEKEKNKEMESLKPPTWSRRARRRGARLSVGKPLGDMYPASQVNADEHDNNGKEWVKAREEFTADSPAHVNVSEDENDVIDLTQMAVTIAVDVERDVPQAHAHHVKEKETARQQKRQPQGQQQNQRHERSQHDRIHDDACHGLNVDANDVVLISSSGSPPIIDDRDGGVNHNQHRDDIVNSNSNSDHDDDAQEEQQPQLSVLESPTIQREIASVLRQKPQTDTSIDPGSRPGSGEGGQDRSAAPNSPSSSSSFEPIDLTRITRSRNLSRRRFRQGRHDDNDFNDDDDNNVNDMDMRDVGATEDQNEQVDKHAMESGLQPKSLHAKTTTKSARSVADAHGSGDDDKNKKNGNNKDVEEENDDNEEDDNNENGDDVLDLVDGDGDTAANNEFGERMDLDGNDEQEQEQEQGQGQEEEGTQSRLKRKRKTKAKPKPPSPKKKVTDTDVIEAIRGNQALYQDVLMMRCVSLSRFSKCLQDADVKLSKAGLHGFLLRQGVMFKSDNNGAKPTQSQQQFMRTLNSDTRELSD